MKVPKRPLTLTKEQAAVRQVEAAIRAFARGDFDIAITLACAAEGMIEENGPHFFGRLRDHPDSGDIPKKAWISHLNSDRDWLKHPSGPKTLVIGRFSTTAAILRAMTKLGAEHGTLLMVEFAKWYEANGEEGADEIE